MSECKWHKKYKEANELFMNGKIDEKEYLERFDQANECCDYCVAVICKKDNIGKRNNQNFVQIPFEMLISQISYKAELEGISVKIINEAYTSKCDALSFEEIKKHENYLGKRIKRGLFQSSIGKRINADVNGSLNILRKVAGNEFLSSRGFVVNPVKISYGFTKSLVEFL